MESEGGTGTTRPVRDLAALDQHRVADVLVGSFAHAVRGAEELPNGIARSAPRGFLRDLHRVEQSLDLRSRSLWRSGSDADPEVEEATGLAEGELNRPWAKACGVLHPVREPERLWPRVCSGAGATCIGTDCLADEREHPGRRPLIRDASQARPNVPWSPVKSEVSDREPVNGRNPIREWLRREEPRGRIRKGNPLARKVARPASARLRRERRDSSESQGRRSHQPGERYGRTAGRLRSIHHSASS